MRFLAEKEILAAGELQVVVDPTVSRLQVVQVAQLARVRQIGDIEAGVAFRSAVAAVKNECMSTMTPRASKATLDVPELSPAAALVASASRTPVKRGRYSRGFIGSIPHVWSLNGVPQLPAAGAAPARDLPATA